MPNNKIKQEDAESLLHALKTTLSAIVNFPERGQKEEFEVKSILDNNVFKITIYRGSVNRVKYNFGALILKNHVPILELHISPGNRHINPDGRIIEGSHWHIYSESYGMAQAFIAENIDSEDFVENTIKFLERFNVIEKPEILSQSDFN